MLTFLVGLKGGLWVWVTGEADDIQSGKFGEEIVSPRHSYLWRNEVNLGRREGGREEKGREGGMEGGRKKKGEERGESWSEELLCSRTAGGENTTLFSTRTSRFLSSSTT